MLTREGTLVSPHIHSKCSYMRFLPLPQLFCCCWRVVYIWIRLLILSIISGAIILNTFDNGEMSAVLINWCCSIHGLSHPFFVTFEMIKLLLWPRGIPACDLASQQSYGGKDSFSSSLSWHYIPMKEFCCSFITLLFISHLNKAIRTGWESEDFPSRAPERSEGAKSKGLYASQEGRTMAAW